MYQELIMDQVQQLAQYLRAKQHFLATAESCTGGMLAAAMTAVPGSSQWFERGFVTYTNQAKQEMLAVPATTLDSVGAVSEQTVRAMAEGALLHSHAHVSVATSGIAGPDGGSEAKPVGLVWFGYAQRDVHSNTIQYCQAKSYQFSGDRQSVRAQAVLQALADLIAIQ